MKNKFSKKEKKNPCGRKHSICKITMNVLLIKIIKSLNGRESNVFFSQESLVIAQDFSYPLSC